MTQTLALTISDEVLEAIAMRVVQLLQQHAEENPQAGYPV